jgi:hypothetical protein
MLSTNAVQREVEATHQGVLAETTAAAEAAAAVGAVVDAVRSGERVR